MAYNDSDLATRTKLRYKKESIIAFQLKKSFFFSNKKGSI